jgi:hypothetical protein
MGKHGSYPPVERDLYRAPAWVVAALAEHLDLAGARVWEPASGTGTMAAALQDAGARVFTSDIVRRRYPLDAVFDFVSDAPNPRARGFYIVTNPPFGERGALAVRFIESGLRRTDGKLALLLPSDFDCAKSRVGLFRDCRRFAGKIILTRRIVWFERSDGEREAPKENHAWFIWRGAGARPCPLTFAYAPGGLEP